MRDSDRMLSRIASEWVQALPPALRPNELCRQYPRVANRLALCWPDATLTHRIFEDLLIDRRGGRRGFPAAVAAELGRLRDWNDSRPRRASTGPDEPWGTLQATADR